MNTAMEKSSGKWDREEKLKMTVILINFLGVLIPDVLYSASRLWLYLIRTALAFFIEVLLAASLLPQYADV